jgi:hypothetical protein
MRFLSLLVAFCFTFNVLASTGTVQELERVLDDYQYSLSVEWDQKDQKFYDVKTKEFFSKLEQLIKEEGLSQEQIMTLVNKKANNKALVEALKLKLSLMGKNISNEDLIKLINESTKDMYSRGASWNGQIIIPVAIGLLIAAVVGYALWWDANHVCVAWENQYVCNTYNNCPSSAGGYYDPYNGGYYGGQYCYGPLYTTTCGYQDVCTQYEKK